MSATEENLTILAAVDSFPLASTLFTPTKTPSSTPPPPSIQINSATGVPRAFYVSFARYLATTHSCPVLLYDYRGIGDSLTGSTPEHARALPLASIQKEWATYDQPAITMFLKDRFPDRAVVIVGHSVGAHIAPLNPAKDSVSRYLFVAPNNAHWRFHPDLKGAISTYLFPAIVAVGTRVGRSPQGLFRANAIGLCEDIPLGVARDWSYWTRFREYCTVEPHIKEVYDRFLADGDNTPNAEEHRTLAIGFTDDAFCGSREAYDAWLRLMPAAKVPLWYLDPKAELGEFGVEAVAHMGFFRKAMKEALWEPLVPFLVDGRFGERVGRGVQGEFRVKAKL
ncbi:uncharacterized protein EV422DRAFT_103506 [Fimicolochytrium jonesii]|uniref:uncharacterized protein n=1 Tax=Fimicolochytrium jonesii TaxID=1396493 RepID=UPI0022FEE960|nr:uncharacterized protein EV422DRAFT_103506 [Fimicolochytrium jonesii]KAI8819695.1 hypothetical protein EV422DRAFT_103506 [Fimicolochytrium jonesii]